MAPDWASLNWWPSMAGWAARIRSYCESTAGSAPVDHDSSGLSRSTRWR